MNISDFIKNVRNIIASKGVKQNFLARKMGINHRKLSDILNRRKVIDIDVINLLCMALEVTPNDLFGYDKTE